MADEQQEEGLLMGGPSSMDYLPQGCLPRSACGSLLASYEDRVVEEGFQLELGCPAQHILMVV